MLVGAFGPNTLQFQIALRVLRLILEERHGPLIAFNTSEFDQFRNFVMENTGAHILYTDHTPDSRILETLVRSRIMSIIFTQKAPNAVAAIMDRHQADLLSAIRILSSHFAAMDPLIDKVETHYVSIDNNSSADFYRMLESLTSLVGTSLTDGLIERSNIAAAEVEAQAFALQPNLHVLPTLPADRFDPRDLQAIEIAFPAIQAIASNGWRWPGRLFYGATIDTTADQPIALLGKSRTLFFGPFMYLPAGNWRSTYHINVARNWSGNTILADILCNLKVIAVGRLALPTEGSFEFSLDFFIESMAMPVEVRLHTLEGAIGGVIELIDIRMTRVQSLSYD